MSKAADIGRVSTKASFHYLWGLVTSTLILSVGTIFVARLLGSDQYGIYAIVLTIPNLLLLFRDWGVNFAMVRFIAQYRAEGRENEIKNILLSGLLFELILGLVISTLAFTTAGFLATNVFNRPYLAPLIQIAAFSIFASGLVAAATAVFTGFERMELNSVMLIFQSTFKTALIIGLVILGSGTSGAVEGFTVGTFIASIVAVVFMWAIYRRLPKQKVKSHLIKAYLSTMLAYCLPLSLGTIITGVLPQFYAFLLPIHYVKDNVMIGNYGVAVNFVVLITFFAAPITTMIFPAFSKLDAQKDSEPLKNIFQFSVKYASFFVVPVVAIVMCLSGPAVATLFGHTYNSAALFLSLFAIQYLYTAAGYLSLNGLLNGQGKTSYVFKLSILTGAIGFPMGYLSILSFGVWGVIATTLVSLVPSIVLGLRFVKKTFGVSVDWISSLKILVSSAVAAVVTFAAISLLTLPSWIELMIGIVIFIFILIPTALFTKAIERPDLANLRDMTSSLGAVEKLVGRLLNLLEKLMDIFKL